MKLYKLSSPSFHEDRFAEFLRDEGTGWHSTEGSLAGERLVEVAGRVCYMSFGSKQSARDNSEYVGNLLRQGHDSVLEHATWTLLLTGISRAFTHQLVRHRIGFSYSQLSQQYHDESEAQFLVPSAIAANPAALAHWRRAMTAATEAYRAILNENQIDLDPASGVASREERRKIRSDARSVLPNATETKIVVTANARALRHFLEVRGATLGDIECRQVSALIFLAVSEDAPSLFQDFESSTLEDGFPVVRKTAPQQLPSA